MLRESELMTLIPWASYGRSLGLWDSGAISHGLVQSRQVPTVEENLWEAVEGHLLARYNALRGKLPGLFRDLEVCPFLDLYLKGGKENFERVVGHENHLNAFIQQHYEVSQ